MPLPMPESPKVNNGNKNDNDFSILMRIKEWTKKRWYMLVTIDIVLGQGEKIVNKLRKPAVDATPKPKIDTDKGEGKRVGQRPPAQDNDDGGGFRRRMRRISPLATRVIDIIANNTLVLGIGLNGCGEVMHFIVPMDNRQHDFPATAPVTPTDTEPAPAAAPEGERHVDRGEIKGVGDPAVVIVPHLPPPSVVTVIHLNPQHPAETQEEEPEPTAAPRPAPDPVTAAREAEERGRDQELHERLDRQKEADLAIDRLSPPTQDQIQKRRNEQLERYKRLLTQARKALDRTEARRNELIDLLPVNTPHYQVEENPEIIELVAIEREIQIQRYACLKRLEKMGISYNQLDSYRYKYFKTRQKE
jgi:hypothetical protein